MLPTNRQLVGKPMLFKNGARSKLVRALYVERISQREDENSFWRQTQVPNYWRMRSDCDVEIVTACREGIREISNITLAATERRSRTDLEDVQSLTPVRKPNTHYT